MTPQLRRIYDYLLTQQEPQTNSQIAMVLGMPVPSVRRATAQLEVKHAKVRFIDNQAYRGASRYAAVTGA